MFGLPISLNTLTVLHYINTLVVNVIIRKQDSCSYVKSRAEKHTLTEIFLHSSNSLLIFPYLCNWNLTKL